MSCSVLAGISLAPPSPQKQGSSPLRTPPGPAPGAQEDFYLRICSDALRLHPSLTIKPPNAQLKLPH